MKKIILTLLIVGLALAHGSFNIELGSRFSVGNRIGYELVCDYGSAVTYHIDGLPEGATLQGNRIILAANTRAGTYILRVRATAASNVFSQRIITLVVATVEVEQVVVEQAQAAVAQGNQVDNRLGSIISRHSTVTDRDPVTYNNNKFPEVDFPTGGNPNAFNDEPVNILGNQAPRTNDNRNEITADDVALRAASERHQNAVKGITNLLTIVDQARANFAQAQRDIETYTKAQNDASAAQRNAQNNIISGENKVAQIQSAIAGLEGLIDSLRGDLDDATAARTSLQTAKKDLLDTISGEQTTKAGLIQELEETNGDLADRVKDLATYLEKCQFLDNEVANTASTLVKAENQFDNVVRDRKIAQADAKNKRGKVNTLRKQLAAAEKALADAEILLADIKAEEERLPKVIAGIAQNLKEVTKKAADCTAKAKALEEEVAELKNDDVVDLTNQIDQVESSILANRQSVSEIDGQLTSNAALIESLKTQLDSASADLQFLNGQIVTANEELRKLYNLGNDANTAVAHARENLNAALSRFESEQRTVSEATFNIERARAEEALARLALEESIAKYSDALPYAIVPNGNGQTFAGTPLGNNPSGSPLGPVATGGNGAQGAYLIKDWTHYLSNAFGAGVNPAYPGSVNELFPFSFLSDVNGNAVRNSFNLRGGCGGSGPLKAITGSVVAIRDDNFDVELNDGSRYTINVNPCTRFSANVQNYQLSLGDQTVVKGNLKAGHSISGTQAVCLH